MVVDQEKLAKLQSAVRTGGKGAPRRKVVKKPKGAVAGGEDPKLQAALKKLAVQPLTCLLYTSPSPRDLSTSRMPSSA